MAFADNQDEAWCMTNFLSHTSLRLAVVIRAELLEVMQRIELPVSPPAFGCQDNCTNIKRALISGFFLKVNSLFSVLCDKNVISCCFIPSTYAVIFILYYICFNLGTPQLSSNNDSVTGGNGKCFSASSVTSGSQDFLFAALIIVWKKQKWSWTWEMTHLYKQITA